MKRPVRHGIKKFLKRRILTALIIIVAASASAGLIYWHTTTTNTQIMQLQQKSDADSAAMDVKIGEIIARKAEELKVRQEAEAKETADASKYADESTAVSIDSSTCNRADSHNNPNKTDVLVNKKHCIRPLNFAPNDLTDIGGGHSLSAKAVPSFNALMSAAAAANIPLNVTSSYRSYGSQISTYSYWVNTSGPAGADTYSARPGYSEHQTGFAFDVASNGCVLNCFGSSAAYGWMQANAADYGFIQRYYAGYESITGYSAEEWHYRYVGTAIAKDMKVKNIKTLEQYWDISGGDYY